MPNIGYDGKLGLGSGQRESIGMSKASITSITVLLTLLVLFVATADARRKKVREKGEDTIYGTMACSVPPPAPAPGAPPNSADTVAMCLARHGQAVIIDDDAHTAIPIENPDAVGEHQGHRVSLSGYMNGESFHVISLRNL